jgi:hypothetical protein
LAVKMCLAGVCGQLLGLERGCARLGRRRENVVYIFEKMWGGFAVHPQQNAG